MGDNHDQRVRDFAWGLTPEGLRVLCKALADRLAAGPVPMLVCRACRTWGIRETDLGPGQACPACDADPMWLDALLPGFDPVEWGGEHQAVWSRRQKGCDCKGQGSGVKCVECGWRGCDSGLPTICGQCETPEPDDGQDGQCPRCGDGASFYPRCPRCGGACCWLYGDDDVWHAHTAPPSIAKALDRALDRALADLYAAQKLQEFFDVPLLGEPFKPTETEDVQ